MHKYKTFWIEQYEGTIKEYYYEYECDKEYLFFIYLKHLKNNNPYMILNKYTKEKLK